MARHTLFSLNALTALTILLSATPLHAGVIVVDPGGGAGAALLQQAIDSASDGDVLLLKAGDYVGSGLPAITISGRSLTLVADTGLAPLPVRAMSVDALPPGGLVLRGLRLAGPQNVDLPGPPDGATLYIDTALNGPPSVVWVEDCEIAGSADVPANDPFDDRTGVRVNGSSGSTAGALVAVRSSISGGKGGLATFSGAGGDAVDLAASGDPEANFFECTLIGGEGGDGALYFFPANGGHGLRIGNGRAFAADTQMSGGGSGPNSQQAASSGAGLLLFLTPTEAWLRGGVVEAGPAQSPAGVESPDVVDPAGHVQTFAATPRSVAVPALLRELQPSSISIRGVGGDLVGLLISPTAKFSLPLAGLQGPLLFHLAQASSLLVVGTITAPDGTLHVPFQVPRLPVGLDVQRLFAQGVFAGAEGTTLGSGSAFCWIANGF